MLARSTGSRRLIRGLVACLGLAIITTIGGAWVFAFPIGTGKSRVSVGGAADGERVVDLIEGRSLGRRNRMWRIDDLTRDTVYSKAARRRAEKFALHGGAAEIKSSVEGGRELAAQLGQTVPSMPTLHPADAVARRGPPWPVSTGDIPDHGIAIIEMALGWPFLSMRYRCDIRVEAAAGATGASSVTSELIHAGSLSLPWFGERRRNGTSPEIHLPLWPMAGGFALNTLVFALGWAALLIGFPAARRRVRRCRGRCPLCAYELGDLTDGCPECGWLRAGAA